MHKLKLMMTGPNTGEVFIDGMKVDGVRGIEVRASVDEINTAKLELYCGVVEVEGDFYDPDVVEVTCLGDEHRRFRRITRWERLARWARRQVRGY